MLISCWFPATLAAVALDASCIEAMSAPVYSTE
jgi:hypothetical protein